MPGPERVTAKVDLSEPRRVHVVGIGGAAMNAIATVLAGLGHTVTGSDLKASAVLDRLRASGIEAIVGHAAANLGDVDLVTVSTAIPDTNPEVTAARERGIPVLSRAEMLSAFTQVRRTIGVAGTHGKTTTSSMLALVLREAGLRPSFIIGGDLNEVGTGALLDQGEWLVVEADESDGTFLELGAEAVVVTSVEPDHLEHWGGFEPLVDAFRQFVIDAPGAKVVCADDPLAARLAAETGATTYGTEAGAEYRIVDVVSARSSVEFTLLHHGDELGRVRLSAPGLYNARNAAGAIVTGLLVGADFASAARALARYGGVARRFEFRGEAAGVTFVDDYAHLPTEVASALAAAKAGDWRRVVCVFQPHRPSRTAALWRDFAHAFVDADLLIVTDIYLHSESPRPGISGKLIVDAVLGAHPGQRVAYLPARASLVPFLWRELRPGDLCLTLGAGDLTSLPDDLLGSAPE
jgi:UDP-N-acetylmuramate--alanine ligase